MSQPIPLALAVSTEHSDAVASMARRVTDRIVDVTHGEALVTDDPSLAVRVAQAGTPVLVLEPFRLSPAVRRQLAELPTMPAHLARCLPSIREVYQACASGKLGEPGLLRIHLWQDRVDDERELLADQLDLAIEVFGRQLPSTVFAVTRSGYTQVHLGFAAGGMALIDLDASLPAGNEYYSLSLVGSTGAAYADDHHNMQLVWDSGGASVLPTKQGPVALRHMLAAFVEAVAQNQAWPVSWEATEAALRVVEEVATSADQQQVVTGGGNG